MKELGPLLDEIAKAYSKDKKCSENDAKTLIREKMVAAQPKGHGTTVRKSTHSILKKEKYIETIIKLNCSFKFTLGNF